MKSSTPNNVAVCSRLRPPSTSGMQGVDQHTPSARGTLVVGPSKTQFSSSFSVLPLGSLPERCHNATRQRRLFFVLRIIPCMNASLLFLFFQLRLGKFGKGRAKLYMCGTKCRESSDDFHAIASHHHTPFCLHGRSKLAVGPNLCRVVPLVW